MWGWIVLATIIVLLLIINNTICLLRFDNNRKNRKLLTYCKNISYTAKNKSAVLLLHEFMGRPATLRRLGKQLYEKGFDVYIPALPGSAPSQKKYCKLGDTNFRTVYNSARKKYLKLRKNYKKVYIVGVSLGGTIGLKLAEEFQNKKPPDVLVTIATAVKLTGKHFRRLITRNLMVIFSGIVALFTKSIRTSKLHPKAKKLIDFKGIEGFIFTATLHSQKLAMRQIKRNLKKITCPLLIIHAENDRTVDVKNADIIAKRVSSNRVKKKIFKLKKDKLSRHHLLVSNKFVKTDVFWQIVKWLK